MIASLFGVFRGRTGGGVIIDVNGVGYLVGVSGVTSALLSERAAEQMGAAAPVFLHIHTAVREDAIALYGFLGEAEKEAFLLLTTVQGIGPKLALSLLGVMPLDALQRAIASRDARALIAADGVGKTVAARVCSELAAKFAAMVAADDYISLGHPDAGAENNEAEDAKSALTNLGYGRAEASRLVMAVIDDPSRPRGLAGVISAALKAAAKNVP